MTEGIPYAHETLVALEAAGAANGAVLIKDEGEPTGPCEGCFKLDLPCTYDYVRKKPGRKNSYVDSSPSDDRVWLCFLLFRLNIWIRLMADLDSTLPHTLRARIADA